MKAYLVLTLFVTSVICFVTDPTLTVAEEDTTDRSIERYQYASITYNNSNNINDKDGQKRAGGDVNHSCPRCNLHSLSFEGLKISEGKQIQLINCSTCGFEWLEMWVLPNWLWLKSSSSYNHWTSVIWDEE
jgi:DNA-directed RNA polymerase subunit M/transcription elongation factor TFIIS